ncbi:MAG: MATE family efflux transporter [Pseudomonadota bacterium]|nr:MATE family efflux transporter [Pseudomonadota bacterium]
MPSAPSPARLPGTVSGDVTPAATPPVTYGLLFRLAAPAAASAVLNNAFRVIDQYAAGAIGTSAQAAIGSCTFVLIAAWAVYALVSGGAGPLMARATGAGDMALRRRVFGASLTGSALLGVGLGALVLVGAPAIAAGLGLKGEVAADAVVFLRTLALGGIPLAVHPLLDAFFVAIGRPGVMMALQVAAAVLNALLNPLFIHTFDLGIAGTGIATCLSRALTVGIGIYVLVREFRPTWADFALGDTILRVMRIGAPITINTLLYAGVYAALLRTTISPLGPQVNAALGIGFSALEGLTYPMFLGVSLGVSSLVGRQLGAGRPEEARRAARLGFPMATGLGLAAGALFWFGAEPLCAPFTRDPVVLAAAITYARILALTQVCVAWEALAEGVLAGAGATRAIFWISAPINLLRVPLGFVLAFELGWGAAGVWWAINLTSVLKALAKGIVAARGQWTKQVV